MSATFDPALGNVRDHIRLALGDTDAGNPLVADQTIDAKLSAFGYAEALAQLAESLISRFGQRPDEYGESGGVRIAWGERIAAWRALVQAARSGQITPPTTTRIPRSRVAVQATDAQAQTTRTSRTDSLTPTVMEGFRSD